MKRKTRKLLFCFGVLFSLHSAVANAQEGKCLLLKLNGAETISVSLKEAPQYWQAGDFLYLKTPKEVQQFDISSVQEIVFQDSYSSTSEVKQDLVSVYPTLTTNSINVVGTSTENVRIVSADGRQMPVRSVKQDGGLQINVSDFPMGVYQLLLGNKSYKFIKGQTVD